MPHCSRRPIACKGLSVGSMPFQEGGAHPAARHSADHVSPNPGHHSPPVMLIGAKHLGGRNREPFAVLRVTPSMYPDVVRVHPRHRSIGRCSRRRDEERWHPGGSLALADKHAAPDGAGQPEPAQGADTAVGCYPRRRFPQAPPPGCRTAAVNPCLAGPTCNAPARCCAGRGAPLPPRSGPFQPRDGADGVDRLDGWTRARPGRQGFAGMLGSDALRTSSWGVPADAPAFCTAGTVAPYASKLDDGNIGAKLGELGGAKGCCCHGE
jgi:hypothetical protein